MSRPGPRSRACSRRSWRSGARSSADCFARGRADGSGCRPRTPVVARRRRQPGLRPRRRRRRARARSREMAGSSTCLNAVVPAPLDVLAVTHYPHVVAGPVHDRDRDQHDRGRGRLARRPGCTAGGRAGRRPPTTRGSTRRRRPSRPARTASLALPVLGDGERTDPDLRGAITGLSLRHDRAAIARAVLEGVAFAIARPARRCSGSAAPGRPSCASPAATPASASWNRIKADVTRARRSGPSPATPPSPGSPCWPGSGPASTATRPTRSPAASGSGRRSSRIPRPAPAYDARCGRLPRAGRRRAVGRAPGDGGG